MERRNHKVKTYIRESGIADDNLNLQAYTSQASTNTSNSDNDYWSAPATRDTSNNIDAKSERTSMYTVCEPGENVVKLLQNHNNNTTELNNHKMEIQRKNRVKLSEGFKHRICDIDDSEHTLQFSGLGKYIYKPRLKYTTCNEKLCSRSKHKTNEDVQTLTANEDVQVINSDKHCSGKSFVDRNISFDRDPQTFSCTFAKELLCSSTPRQGPKQLTSPNIEATSIESVNTEF